jgi:hypothetical protein
METPPNESAPGHDIPDPSEVPDPPPAESDDDSEEGE